MNKFINITLVSLILSGALLVFGANTALADQTITRYATVGQVFELTLSDPVGWTGGSLTHYALSIPSGASFNSSTGRMTWTPQQTGQYTATFRSIDRYGNYCITEVIINVQGASIYNPPVYPPYQPVCTLTVPTVPNSVVKEGELFSYQIFANGNGVKTYRVVSGPPGLTVGSDGWVRWVPNYDKARATPYLVSIGVTNGECEQFSNFYITVTDVIPYVPPTPPPTPTPTPTPEPEPEPELITELPCSRTAICGLLTDKELLTIALEKMNQSETVAINDKTESTSGIGFVAGAFAILGDVFSSGLFLFWLALILLLLLYWEHRKRKLMEQEIKLIEARTRQVEANHNVNSNGNANMNDSNGLGEDNIIE